MNNKQIAKTLHHLADLLELSGENAFRVRAYRRAARSVENSRQNFIHIYDRLEELDGIGKGMAETIREIIQTGTTSLLEERKKALPPGLIELLQLSGVGPKTIYTLYQALNITNIDELKEAVEKQKVRSLKGFGPKKEEKILKAIEAYQQRPNRVLWSEALFLAERLLSQLQELPFTEQAEIAGSLRRKKETIKDIDLLVATENVREVIHAIKQFPEMKEMLTEGTTKIHFLAEWEEVSLPVDVRFVTIEQFASALHHFTGSTDHNIRIRQIGKKLGYKVNEYGMEDRSSGKILTFETEADFFRQLQLPYIPPEIREDRGEIEAGMTDQLPSPITQEMMKGDLHTHTLYSDGAHSIEEMAQAAQQMGYQYLAITDHSRSLRVASGLSIEELFEQWKEIERINEQLAPFRILKGTEVDILPDGSLDYPDEILSQMDIVIASIHTSFQLDRKTMTNRIIKAMQNPYVHIIGHPTGRLLLRREPYALDLEQIFHVARETGTLLELNANPHRLDLSDINLKKAKEEYQIKFSINTDAHSIEQLSLISFGIGTAQRGWLEKNDILNMQPWEEAKKWIKNASSR